MTDDKLQEAYNRYLERHAGQARIEPPADRVAALVAREGGEDERLRTLDVLLASGDGRRDLDVAWAVARATERTTRRRRPMWYAAAATALLTVGIGGSVLLRGGDDVAPPGAGRVAPPPGGSEVMRGEDAPVRLVAPTGDPVPSVGVEFIWRRAASASEYTLVVVDTAGNEVYAEATPDSSVVLPARVQLVPGGAYLWWVEAVLADGSTVSAVTQRLYVRAQPE